MSSEVRDPTSPSPLCLASHRHRGRARSNLARPRAHPGASPPPLPFWQRPDSRLDRAPYDSGAHGYESSRQATTTRSGTAARDARVTRARGARRAARRTHEDRTPRVSSRPRASIRGSRWSFASRSSPQGSAVVGRRAHKRSRGDAMPPTPGSAPRAVDHPDPRDETRDETFAETATSSTRRSRAIQPPADADADDDGPMGRRGATTARVSRARPTTNRRPIPRGGRRRPGDPRPARLRAHFPLNPNPKPQTSPPRTSPR